MRAVYFGSGAFSVPSLRAVLASCHELAGVFTQPGRPAGRGGKVRHTPIAQAARQAGLEVVECGDVNAPEAIADLRARRADVICVADFGQMLRRKVLASARLGAVNVHASLLPELRGAAPVNWALIRGYRRTGVTTFRIVRAMDAGAVYRQAATEIGPDETADELAGRLAEMGGEALRWTLDALADGSAEAVEQDHTRATLAPRLRKEDGVVDWSAGAETVCNRVRGTWPWPGAQAVLCSGGRELAVTIAAAAVEPGGARGAPGVLDGDLAVSTGSGRVRIVRVRPAGKRLMDWRDFVNGYRPRAGDGFAGDRR